MLLACRQVSRKSGSLVVVWLVPRMAFRANPLQALHIAVALMKAGQRVATIDRGLPPASFPHYIKQAATHHARRLGAPHRLSTVELPMGIAVASRSCPPCVSPTTRLPNFPSIHG